MEETKKLPISVIIIAKNEEKILSRCLSSCDFASEIVSVINNCTDQTRSILESFGAKVYEYDWQGFVIQKNRAISHTTYDWVFSIDADEEVTSKTKRELNNFFEKKSSLYTAMSFCRKTWLINRWIKHGEWYPDRVIRLFHKKRCYFSGNFVHEKLIVNGDTYQSKAHILHYSFPNMYVFLHKTENFSRYFIEAHGDKKSFHVAIVLFRSFWKFFRSYVLKLGYLDGYPGFIVAVQSAFGTYFKYTMLLEEQHKHIKPQHELEDL